MLDNADLTKQQHLHSKVTATMKAVKKCQISVSFLILLTPWALSFFKIKHQKGMSRVKENYGSGRSVTLLLEPSKTIQNCEWVYYCFMFKAHVMV